MKDINSIERKTAVRFRAAMNAALHFLAITSIFVTFPYAYRVAGNVMPETMAGPVAGVVAFLIYFFIDAPLSNSLNYLIRTSARGSGLSIRFWSFSSGQVRRAIAFGLALLTMVLTGGMSFISSTLIADTAAPAPDDRELATQRERDRAEHTTILDEMKAAESKAELDIARAKRDGGKLVASTINAGADRWRSLYRERNGWFMKQGGAIRKYRQSIAQAQADSAALVDQARAVYSDVTRTKAAHLAASDTVTLVTDRAFSVRADRAALLFSTLWRFVFAMDLAAVAMVIVFFAFLCSYFRDGGTLPESKSSFGEALSEWQNRKWDQFTEWLFRRNAPTERPPKPKPAPVRAPADGPSAPAEDLARMEAERAAKQAAEQAEQLRIIAEQVAEQRRQLAEQRAEQKSGTIAGNPVTNSVSGAEQKSGTVAEQAEQVTEHSGEITVRIVRQDGKPVVRHEGRDGVKFYTLSEVQSLKSTYAKRAREAKSAASRATNERNYRLFCVYENELNNAK